MINQRAYKFYVLVGDKIESGWESQEDAREQLKNLADPRAGKVFAKAGLQKRGIDPSKDASWLGATPTVRAKTTVREGRRLGRKVMSRRQPSLPGFPDIPDKLEIKIPDMPMWEQIGGDMDPGTYGGTIAKGDGNVIELLKIQPVREHVGDKEAADVGFPFWTREAQFDLSDLDPNNDDVKSALQYTGFTESDQKTWFEEATPEERALMIAESLLDYGRADEGPSGWSGSLPDYEVKWQSGETAMLPAYLADEDEAFKNDVLGYDDIRSKLEEMVEKVANDSAAASRSTVGDQEADDAERDGFDPKSLVGVAEFGDSVGVNGDVESEKTLAGVEAELEKDGYEMTDIGGRVPDTEEHVSPDSVIRFVASEMELPIETVREAAQGIDWWPKDRYDEIASTTSGYANVWGKKDKHAHVEDGDYVVQGSWSDGRISETFGVDDEEAAISAAKKMLRDPTFEGDSVRVITRDGELVWSSEGDDEGVGERRRVKSKRRR